MTELWLSEDKNFLMTETRGRPLCLMECQDKSKNSEDNNNRKKTKKISRCVSKIFQRLYIDVFLYFYKQFSIDYQRQLTERNVGGKTFAWLTFGLLGR